MSDPTIEEQIAECKAELDNCCENYKNCIAMFEADQSEENLASVKTCIEQCKRKHHQYCKLRRDFARQISIEHLPEELKSMMR